MAIWNPSHDLQRRRIPCSNFAHHLLPISTNSSWMVVQSVIWQFHILVWLNLKGTIVLVAQLRNPFLRWYIWRQGWFSLGRGKKKDTWHRFFRLFTAALLHGSVSALSQISALETSPTPANAYWSLWSAVFWKIDLVLVADEIQRITKHVLYDFLKSFTVGPLLSSRCNFLANFTCSKSPGDSKILIAIYYIENR